MKSYVSGSLVKRKEYASFEPSRINRPWAIDDMKVLEALSKADRQLGRLDSFSGYIPNLDIFVQMHVTKEATLSSKIENTVTKIEEAILPEDKIEEERRDDWLEVNHYIQAMKAAQKNLEHLPFSNRLLGQAHEMLLSGGVRGENKTPGEFRRSQNWIGGSNPGNARFVPPIHENVAELMSDLELFAHNDDLHLPPLVKAAIMHYQFETIHPYLDGNGRIGRLMIPLYLISAGILKQPVLYLSAYFEKNREEYYERLTRVRSKNEMNEWLRFFLDGIEETAKIGIVTFDKILRFQKHWEAEMHTWGSIAAPSAKLLQHLFVNPWVNAQVVASTTGASLPTAYKIIEKYSSVELLKETTSKKRERIYLFEPYLNLFH